MRIRIKSRRGRILRGFPWVEAVQGDLLEKLDTLRKLGFKFNLNKLRSLALQVLRTSENISYSSNMIYPRNEKPLHENVDSVWF